MFVCNPLTESRKLEARRLWAEGLSSRDIVKATGLTRIQIWNYICNSDGQWVGQPSVNYRRRSIMSGVLLLGKRLGFPLRMMAKYLNLKEPTARKIQKVKPMGSASIKIELVGDCRSVTNEIIPAGQYTVCNTAGLTVMLTANNLTAVYETTPVLIACKSRLIDNTSINR